MSLKSIASGLMLILPCTLFGAQAYFCPQNHRYINIGMTQEEVIAACGMPLSKQDSNQPILQKVPVQQLIYNNKGTDPSTSMWNIPTGTAFYGVWNIPTGVGGTQIKIDVVNKQVRAIEINGSGDNAVSVCGSGVQIGDPVGKVYAACGSPTVINNTYVNQVVPTAQKPQVWIYQPGEFQPPVSLTFADGKLQSIN